jgi:RimJ/RimL family protein N-acetyltransferase
MCDRALADMLAILRNPIDQRVTRATKTIGIKRRARSSIALRFSWNRSFSGNSIHGEQRSPIRYAFTMRIPPVSLMTPRLLLRPHKETDISALTAALNDFEVARRLRNVPHPFTETHARERLAASAKGAIDGLTETFAVVRLHDQRFIGGVGLAFDESGLVASLGYWIARDEWRHGYARESVQRVVQYAFTERSPSLIRMETHRGACLLRARFAKSLSKKYTIAVSMKSAARIATKSIDHARSARDQFLVHFTRQLTHQTFRQIKAQSRSTKEFRERTRTSKRKTLLVLR